MSIPTLHPSVLLPQLGNDREGLSEAGVGQWLCTLISGHQAAQVNFLLCVGLGKGVSMQGAQGLGVAFFFALAISLFLLLLGRWVIESGCESYFHSQETFLSLKLHSHAIDLSLPSCALLCASWTAAVDAGTGLGSRRSHPHHPWLINLSPSQGPNFFFHFTYKKLGPSITYQIRLLTTLHPDPFLSPGKDSGGFGK